MTEIEQVNLLIDAAQAEGADWDDQEGKPVSVHTANSSKWLMARLAEIAKGNWVRPTISATPDGGIHFSWMVSEGRTCLTVFGTASGYRIAGQFAQKKTSEPTDCLNAAFTH